jgi:hypothetical protein
MPQDVQNFVAAAGIKQVGYFLLFVNILQLKKNYPCPSLKSDLEIVSINNNYPNFD